MSTSTLTLQLKRKKKERKKVWKTKLQTSCTSFLQPYFGPYSNKISYQLLMIPEMMVATSGRASRTTPQGSPGPVNIWLTRPRFSPESTPKRKKKRNKLFLQEGKTTLESVAVIGLQAGRFHLPHYRWQRVKPTRILTSQTRTRKPKPVPATRHGYKTILVPTICGYPHTRGQTRVPANFRKSSI